MPPRVVGAAQAGGLGGFLETIPPITRFFAGSIFVLALAHYVGLLNPVSIALVWPEVYGHYQVWRLLTCHTFMAFSMGFVFNMVFLIKYGGSLETEVFRFNPADYLFMLICGGVFLMTVPPLVGKPLYFTTGPLVLMMVYVWSRNFPDVPVNIYGLFTIQSFYLPFAFVAMTIVFGGSPIPDLFGIAAGHIWYFFTDLYPRSSGRNLLKTPKLLTSWVSNMGVGPPPTVEEQQQRGVFRGRGQRLGTQ